MAIKICVVGSGYVGLVTGACLADFGTQVVCVDKDIAKIDLDDTIDIAEANHPGKSGDHIYRDALKRLRIMEYLYDKALNKKRIYPKNFTDLTEPESTTISMRETGDSTGIFSSFGRNAARQTSNTARNATLAATRGNVHKPCHF